jgi:hypothetical protein
MHRKGRSHRAHLLASRFWVDGVKGVGFPKVADMELRKRIVEVRCCGKRVEFIDAEYFYMFPKEFRLLDLELCPKGW